MVCEAWAVPYFLWCQRQRRCIWCAAPRKAGAFPAGPGVHFNLSHAGDYAAAVFDEGEVGIDVEQVRRVNVNVMRRQFTAEENAYLLSEPDAFLRLWTRKESYCKAVGEGLHLPLLRLMCWRIRWQEGLRLQQRRRSGKRMAGQFYLYTEVPVKGYVLSVCADIPSRGVLWRTLICGNYLTAFPKITIINSSAKKDGIDHVR